MNAFGYIGLMILGALGAYFVREAMRAEKDALLEYEQMLLFLEHMRREIKCFMRTPSEICSSFGGGLLEERGILAAFGEGRISDMTELCRMKEEDKRMLASFFGRFGTGLRESELEALSDVISRLSRRVDAVRAESEKSRKLTPVIYVFAFISLVLLLI